MVFLAEPRDIRSKANARQHNGKDTGQLFNVEPTQFNNEETVLASPLNFKKYSESGIPVSDLFPHAAQCVDELAVVHSMTSGFPERAKECIFSFRDRFLQWDPKNQRPELYNLYNGMINQGESTRVFPMSNWTELDVWLYIWLQDIPAVPLYFATPRPVVDRQGTMIMVDDERMVFEPGERPRTEVVRFRTLGCYPLTGAVHSEADTLPTIIQEMLLNKHSERQGRLDSDQEGSMEIKKKEGYF